MSRAELEKLTFEDALARVEAVIDRIESGEAGLEESLREYERGVELMRRCREILSRTELRVEELTKKLMSADHAAATDAADSDD